MTTLYCAFNGQNGDAEYHIGVATQTAGVWAEYGSNPVLSKGTGWEAGGVKDPRLVWDGSQYVMFYDGYDVSLNFSIGRATAPSIDGPWTKYGSNPVISGGYVAPVVYFGDSIDGHTWWMWATKSSQIYLFHSDDGIAWTLNGSVLSGTAATWDAAGLGGGAVILSGSTFYLFYNNTDGIGLATFTTPTGTYTKYGSNPILQPRHLVSHTTATITSNVSAGATTVAVGSGLADGLQIGEPVLLVDGTHGPEVQFVAAPAPTSTTVTLTTGTTNPYTSGSGIIRSFAYIQIDARSVLERADGTFELFGTAFKPVNDLSLGGGQETLWEGSIRWTAPALTGPWTWDYTTGLVFPLYPATSNWHKYSAENPSLITLAEVVTSSGVGFWVDRELDGFADSGTTSPDEAGMLARMLPEGDGVTTTSDNLTDYLMSISWHVGETSDLLGGSGGDTLTATLKNTSGIFNPDNTGSAFYPMKLGAPVWFGANADGTLSGTGQTVYPLFAGRLREVAPIPAGGATDAPTVEFICDGILSDYARKSVHVADSTTRSQGDFRAAVLAAIDPTAGLDLDDELDTLPLSSADSTNALSVLESLNTANGSSHDIDPQQLSDWFNYRSLNRQYKLGAAADWSLDAGSEHVTDIAGLRYNADTVINDQRATVDPVRISAAVGTVWTYEKAPFHLTGNLVIWAEFSDYVANPSLDINLVTGSVTSTLTSFGHSAKIELYSAGAQISTLVVQGYATIRDSAVSVSTDYLPEAGPSQASYGVRSGSTLSGDLLGTTASAQGIVDHIVYRRHDPLRRPAVTVANWLPSMFAVKLRDVISLTVSQLDMAGRLFDVVGMDGKCDYASADGVLWEMTYQLQESSLQTPVTFFTVGTSTLAGPDMLGY